MDAQERLHVVLGTGPLGLAVARHLAAGGDRIRVVNRSGRADLPEGVEVIAANVAEAGDAKRACDGAAVVYHCANPPYARWPELHPPLMRAIIEGASSAGAKLVFGDNLYAYGPVDGPLTEDLLHRARGRNGRTRARIAAALLAAHQDGLVRAAIGRGSDFFGPHAHQSIVGGRVFARAVMDKPAQVLGNPDAPHTVTYLEDFVRALVTLGEREEALGNVWHVPNAEAVSMRQFVQMVFADLGRPPRLRVVPLWGLVLAGMFSPTLRAVRNSCISRSARGLSIVANLSGPSGGTRQRSAKRSTRLSPSSGKPRAVVMAGQLVSETQAWSDRLDDFFANVRVEFVDNVGHVTPLECPSDFDGALVAACRHIAFL
jgi:nucleoside-diphosphate-sugar epimerase